MKSRFGPGRPRAEDIVLEVAGARGVGPAGWSAGHALGLSTQVPAVLECAVVGTPPAGIPGVRFHSRRNFARLRLRYDEIALLEVLRGWPEHVEADWPDLERAVGRLRDAGKIRLERVRTVAEKERAPALRERVTRLIEGLEGRVPSNARPPG